MICCDDQDLGWSATDSEALFPPSAAPAADAATGSKRPPPAAVKKAAPGADKKSPPGNDGQAPPMTEEIVTGYDTPCHVACVQCHNAATVQLKADLAAATTLLKDSMYAWQRNETANKERWAHYLQVLGDVV